MSGLIKKEFLLIKTSLNLRLIIFFAVYLILMSYMDIDGSFILPIISIMLCMNGFSYDEMSNFNSYVCTLPDGRKNTVRAKYISSLAVSFGVSILSAVISFLAFSVKNNAFPNLILTNIMISLITVIIMISFAYPMMFKFGSNNGRITMFILIFAIAIGIGIASNFIGDDAMTSLLQSVEKYMLIIIPVLLVVLLAASYLISVRVFSNKEF